MDVEIDVGDNKHMHGTATALHLQMQTDEELEHKLAAHPDVKPHSRILAKEEGHDESKFPKHITKSWEDLSTGGKMHRRKQVLYSAGRLSKSHADEMKLLHFCLDKSERVKKEDDIHTELPAVISALKQSGASLEFQVRFLEKLATQGYIHMPRGALAKHLKLTKKEFDQIVDEGMDVESIKGGER